MQKSLFAPDMHASALLNPNTEGEVTLTIFYHVDITPDTPEKWYVVKTCLHKWIVAAHRRSDPNILVTIDRADPWCFSNHLLCDCLQQVCADIHGSGSVLKLRPYEQDLVQVRTVVQYACSKIAQCEWINTLISNLCDYEYETKRNTKSLLV